MIEQDGNFLAELVLWLGVRNGNACASGLQEQRRRHPGLAQADYEHAFVGEIHRPIVQPSPRRHRDTEKKQNKGKTPEAHGTSVKLTPTIALLFFVSL
jgi:hypothetical protein